MSKSCLLVSKKSFQNFNTSKIDQHLGKKDQTNSGKLKNLLSGFPPPPSGPATVLTLVVSQLLLGS